MAPSPSRTTAGTSFCSLKTGWMKSTSGPRLPIGGSRGEVGSPFFFKLKARFEHTVCGFAFFARYARLPDWLAWETFEVKNGCPSLDNMRERIGGIRARIEYRPQIPSNEIGCILLAQPTFFSPNEWIR